MTGHRKNEQVWAFIKHSMVIISYCSRQFLKSFVFRRFQRLDLGLRGFGLDPLFYRIRCAADKREALQIALARCDEERDVVIVIRVQDGNFFF